MSLDGPSPCVNCGHDYSEHGDKDKCYYVVDEVTKEMATDAQDNSLAGEPIYCLCPGFEPEEGPDPDPEAI